jgi:hypothetical protein
MGLKCKIRGLIHFFGRSVLLTPVDASGCQRVPKNDLRQFAEPSLETGGVLDGALSEDDCRLCGRVSVMGVHKIGDEKNADVRHD